MVRATIKEAEALRRKQRVPPEQQTAERDRAADWIERQVVEGDLDWATTTLRELGDRSEWSRQHIANVVDAYFRPAEQSGVAAELIGDIPTPDGTSDFQNGFAMGWREGVRWALEHDEKIEELLRTEPEISH